MCWPTSDGSRLVLAACCPAQASDAIHLVHGGGSVSPDGIITYQNQANNAQSPHLCCLGDAGGQLRDVWGDPVGHPWTPCAPACGKRIYGCRKCSRPYMTNHCRLTHEQDCIHKIKKRRVQCGCGRSYSSHEAVRKHQRKGKCTLRKASASAGLGS